MASYVADEVALCDRALRAVKTVQLETTPLIADSLRVYLLL